MRSPVVLPGQHIGWAVEDGDARARLAASWVREGLAGDERIVYVEPSTREGMFLRHLEAEGIDWRGPARNGQLMVLTPAALHLCGDVFDPRRRMSEHAVFVEQSQAQGYSAVRIAAEPADALVVMRDLKGWMEYETLLDDLCHTHPLSVLCVRQHGVLAPDLASFVRVHPRGVADERMGILVEPGRIRLSGEVDFSNVDLLAGLLTVLAPSPDDVVVDMGGLSFIDVRATAEIVRLARRLSPNGLVRICAPPSQVRTILEAVGQENDVELVAEGLTS